MILSACFVEENVKMAATLCSREFGEAHKEAGCGLSVNLFVQVENFRR